MKWVKINPSRGYGDGVWNVLSDNGSEYTLKNKDGKKVEIYKAHCYAALPTDIKKCFG